MVLHSGQVYKRSFDLSALYDLSDGGEDQVVAQGSVHLAPLGTTGLSGERIAYESNEITISVDRQESAVKAQLLSDHTIMADPFLGCDETSRKVTLRALEKVVTRAKNAAHAAETGDGNIFVFREIQSPSPYYNTVVAEMFTEISTLASDIISGKGSVHYYCKETDELLEFWGGSECER